MVTKLHSLFFQVVKAGQAKQREEQMRPGASAVQRMQTPAVSAEEIAAVELDAQDEKLLGQLEQEAAARGEAFAPAEEREKFKVTIRACEHI